MAAVELGLFLASVAAPKAAAMPGMILLVSDQDPVGARRAFGVAADDQ
jgi:hypothetical protein